MGLSWFPPFKDSLFFLVYIFRELLEKVMGLLTSPSPTQKITDNLYSVREGHVAYFIYKKGDNTVAVDCGFGNSLAGLKKLSLNPIDVSHVFLTHSDRDHAGGLKFFKNASVYMSKDEEQMIDGTTPRFMWFVRNSIRDGRKLNLLGDGQIIQVGDIRVKAFSTPGHTPGSMSFLIDDSVLFTGDLLIIKDGLVRPSPGFLNKDNNQVTESIRKMARLREVKVLCTAHSGHTKDFKAAMRQWREKDVE
jgi:hydroxyacylglutathione hydrolase